MSDNDPLDLFFTEQEQESPHILYSVLGITVTSENELEQVSQDVIKKAYRKSAIKYHPDKHVTKSQVEKDDMAKEFQKVSFAYTVLSDETRKKRYDSTGKTTESMFEGAEEMGWAAYFDALFTKVDLKMLDEDKKRYQESEEEKKDLVEAYTNSNGDLDVIMTKIPHSTTADEQRFVTIINEAIKAGTIDSCKAWETSRKDTKARKRRIKEEKGEALEAEEHAKSLGIWEEMYGEGKSTSGGKRKSTTQGANEVETSPSAKRAKGKDAKATEAKGQKGEQEGDDLSALQAMIQNRQQKRQSAMDSLFEKYSNPPAKSKKSKKK